MRGLAAFILVMGLSPAAMAESQVSPPQPPGAQLAAPSPTTPPQPATPPASAPGVAARSPTTPPASDRFVFVPSGIDRVVNFVAQLNPDCTSLGTTEVRVETKPEHGTLTVQQGDNFASYPMNSPMQHCNDAKSPGLFTHYKSADGYVGEDHAQVLYLLPSATAIVVRYTILVR